MLAKCHVLPRWLETLNSHARGSLQCPHSLCLLFLVELFQLELSDVSSSKTHSTALIPSMISIILDGINMAVLDLRRVCLPFSLNTRSKQTNKQTNPPPPKPKPNQIKPYQSAEVQIQRKLVHLLFYYCFVEIVSRLASNSRALCLCPQSLAPF